jgi:hypothetical protein
MLGRRSSGSEPGNQTPNLPRTPYLLYLRFVVRSLSRRPAFALIVIVTIAIAIAATAMMMAIVNAAIVRPLPFREADRLVFAEGFARREQATRGVSYLLHPADTRARGSTGCNGFSGRYQLSGESLRFENLVSTLRACVDPELNRQEPAFLDALGATRS